MKGSGKLSGAVMQIAFILTALHFQSLISAPAMTSLCFSPPPSLLSLSSSAPSIPFFPLFHVFFFLSHFPFIPLYESPSIYFSPWLLLLYSLSIYPPQSQRSSCCIYLHVVEKKEEEEEERSRNTLEVSVNHYH